MIKIEKTEVLGWEHAIRGMRNPFNAWDKIDSGICDVECYGDCNGCGRCDGTAEDGDYVIGPNDHDRMMKLADGGPVHAKYRRMIVVYVDITAPLYWWKEFDTYKVGTVANSCSTMHKIADKEFVLDDFSHDRLNDVSIECLEDTIIRLNHCRLAYLENPIREWFDQMIQLLPSSYNQKRTVMMNYEVLTGMYRWRKGHRLKEWREFCQWIEQLPYSEIITGNEVK